MKEAEPFYRIALALNPDFKEAWMNLGLVAFELGRTEEAQACQREALRLDPESPDAQNNLGMIHYSLGRIAEAENCFRAALRLDSAQPNATLNLGSARQLAGSIDEAEALFRRALALGAEPVRVKTNLALALMEQVRPQEAEQCCREALAINPASAEAHSNLALALLTMGRLEEGWREYEHRWEVEAMSAPLPVLPQPRWCGQDLNGETVLLYAEQGFGDTLQFCRYVPMVAAAGGRVVLVVPKALRRLMTTLDGVADLLSEEDTLDLKPFDYHCPLLSLPFAFGTTLETIPAPASYLRGDAAAWSEFLGALPGLKVGLVWAGKSRTAQPHAVAIDKRRSMRLADMAPLLSVPGCSFVSLQLGPSGGADADGGRGATRRVRTDARLGGYGGPDHGAGSGDRGGYGGGASGGGAGQAGMDAEPVRSRAGGGFWAATTRLGTRVCGCSARAAEAIGPA